MKAWFRGELEHTILLGDLFLFFYFYFHLLVIANEETFATMVNWTI